MDAWVSPSTTIDGVLTANSTLLASCNQNLGTTPGPVVFDVFLRLIPMHLAIAPPATDSATTTGIDESYTLFCGCDGGELDDCCGPNTGALSLRQRVLVPQPYLVKPGELFSIICCLVDMRYHPAKDAATDAAALLASTNDEITRRQSQLDAGLKSFNADGRAAIPTQPECCDSNYDAQSNPKIRREKPCLNTCIPAFTSKKSSAAQSRSRNLGPMRVKATACKTSNGWYSTLAFGTGPRKFRRPSHNSSNEVSSKKSHLPTAKYFTTSLRVMSPPFSKGHHETLTRDDDE